MKSAAKKPSAGYTLIELVTAASLGIVLLSLSATAFYKSKRPADTERAASVYRAAASQARAAAVARLAPCRLIAEHAPRGDRISIERRTSEPPYKWNMISATNILDNTSVSFTVNSESPPLTGPGPVIYFRADGSCCTSEEDLELPDGEDGIDIDFISIPAHEKDEGRIRSIRFDTRSGISSYRERSFSNGR